MSRPRVDHEIRALIHQMQSDNVGWGAAQDSQGIVEIGFHPFASDGFKLYETFPQTAFTGLANLSPQSCRWLSGDGLLCGTTGHVSPLVSLDCH